MSDLQDSGEPADDTLFADVTGQSAPAAETPAPATTTTTQPEPAPAPEPAIPPSRLREEAEARRTAERERDELRGRLAALEERSKPAVEAPKSPDFWEDPNAFVQTALTPLQQQFEQQMQDVREHYSKQAAVAQHGADVVKAAEEAVEEALRQLPPEHQARMRAARGKDLDPFGEMVKWNKQRLAMQEVGSDPAAYKARIREEAMKDPEFQKAVMEAARGTAQQTNNTITRPPVSSIPSLSKVGAVALPDGQDEASDNELFSSITKRRRG